jgi:hypothetical protein
MIDFILPGGVSREVGLAELLESLGRARHSVCTSFSAERLSLTARVSEIILRGGVQSRQPSVVHFAYWTRKAAIARLTKDHVDRLPPGCLARPRGLVFHLPPQNVETVFLYSWVISYLAGNANLTRLPTELSADMADLLGLFQAALAEAQDESQMFVRYPVNLEINRVLSAACDARLVWGGDAKVATFAKLPLRNGGKSVWFGDRRSFAVFKGSALGALTSRDRRALASRLYNDIFVFDQLACSSPQWLYVLGDSNEDSPAVEALLQDLSDVASERGSEPPTSHVIQKMVSSMARAGAGGVTTVTRHSNALTTILAGTARNAPSTGGGLLTVTYAAEISDIYLSLCENIQTIVHFGFAEEELNDLVRGLPPLAVTRVVPAGAALDFDAVWDGYDLLSELTRLLRLTAN